MISPSLLAALVVSGFEISGDPLSVVATAVTPVVMVSATAILISGVNTRYISISDRVRNLSHEYRTETLTPERRASIQRQVAIFQLRLRLACWAARLLYIAVGLFVAVALLIGGSIWHRFFKPLTLPIFLTGLGLIVTAIVLQFLELDASNHTINLEVAEVLGRPVSKI